MAKELKKVLILAGIFPPDFGGPASYVPLIARHLKEQGAQVDVVCYSGAQKHDFDSNYNFQVHRVRRGGFALFRELKFLLKVIGLSRHSDLIYANGHDFKAWLLGFICRLPVVHKIVGDISWERAQNKGWFKGPLDDYVTAKLSPLSGVVRFFWSFPLKNANQIIVPSDYLKKIMLKYGVSEDKITVIYNAYLPASDQLTCDFKNPREKTFVTVCRLVPWKGVNGILSAMRAFPDYNLKVIGDGPLMDSLKAEALALNVSEQVKFLGKMGRSEIMKTLSESSLFILNSTYEGLPHVVLEAFESKTPVVATRAGGTPEIVIDNQTGALVDVGSKEALVGGIQRALKSEKHFVQEAEKMLSQKFEKRRMFRETFNVLNGHTKTGVLYG